MTKANTFTAFRSTTKYGVDVSYSRFYKSNNHHKLILRPSAQFSCCQILITKLSVTIYISALYRPTIISNDAITQPM